MLYALYALISIIFIILAYELGLCHGWDEGWDQCEDIFTSDESDNNIIIVKKRD